MRDSDWNEVSLGDIIEKVSKPVDVEPHQLYRQIGIRSHGKGLFDKEPVSGASLGDKRVFWVEPDCLIVNIVFAWEMAVARTTENDIGKIASHRFPMFKPLPGKADVDFLTYLFQTPIGRHLLTLASPGGAGRNKTLGQDAFLNSVIRVPNIETQRIISRALITWDRAINVAAQLCESSRNQKTVLMGELLTGRRRLPGFSAQFSQREMHHIADVDRKSLLNNTQSNYSFRYISLADVEPGRIADLLPRTTFGEAPSRARRVLAPGDVLLSTVRPNLMGHARVTCSHADCIASTGFAVLTVKDGFSADYLFHYLFSKNMIEQINQLVTGSNYPAINSSDVQRLKIYCPEQAEQLAIAAILNNADRVIGNLEAQVSRLKSEKTGLMQQLMTGKRQIQARELAA
ncbi:MAG: restriction endonuclease subunit S [Hyphomicrobium sp.]|nr:MAG: restriction endonuclease subunit S [Hyphomicrobium sp.]